MKRFYEDDANSTLARGKKDCIVKNKIKKQKRFLNNSLRFLYMKFRQKSESVISYTIFTRLRPFWVVTKKVSERDTCLCMMHENINMICNRLTKLSVVSDNNLDRLIEKEMYCDPCTVKCLFRQCSICKSKKIFCSLSENRENKITYYDVWEKRLRKDMMESHIVE